MNGECCSEWLLQPAALPSIRPYLSCPTTRPHTLHVHTHHTTYVHTQQTYSIQLLNLRFASCAALSCLLRAFRC